MKPLLLEDREGVASFDVGNRGRARHRPRAAHRVLTGEAPDRRVDITNRRAYSEPGAEANNNQAGEDERAMRVDKRFDASGIRNAHWDHAVQSNGCAAPLATKFRLVCCRFIRIYCPAVIKRM